MHVFIVVRVEGEWSDTDWKNHAVYADKDNALVTTWKEALKDWNAEFHVEEWDIDANEKVTTYYIDNTGLQKSYMCQYIADLEEELHTTNTLPFTLKHKFTKAQ
jgi:hypothetical protein